MMTEPDFNRAFLALGSNIDPETNLGEAVRMLCRYGRVTAVSRVWETLPDGYADQPNILNAAVLLETGLTAHQLRLEAIADIEQSLHRVRDPNNRNAPRTIDIDISLFNDEILQIEHRRIPDPAILDKSFVAIPLADLDPHHVHPIDGRTLQDIVDGFSRAAADMQLRPDIVLPSSSIRA